MPAVSPQLGCRQYPSAVVALFTYVCSSYACARFAGWGAAAPFAQFMASSVSPGAAAPPLLTSLTNCLSCGALMAFYAGVSYLSCVIPVASVLVAQRVLAQCCQSGVFFPKSSVFALVLGDFCSWLWNFRACN